MVTLQKMITISYKALKHVLEEAEEEGLEGGGRKRRRGDVRSLMRKISFEGKCEKMKNGKEKKLKKECVLR